MRKITSKELERKKQKRNQLLLGIFLVFVMLGSVFGITIYSFGSSNNQNKKYVFNDYEFYYNNGFWITSINKLNKENIFIFNFLPNETKYSKLNASLDKKLIDYFDKTIYFQSDTISSAYSLQRNLQPIALRMQKACINSENCNENVPIKSCENDFIIIQNSSSSEIFQYENCIFIKAPKQNLTKITEEFLYRITDIR